MPKNADRSLLRLSIQVGEIAVRDSRLVRIDECLDGGRASDIAKTIGITRRTLYRWLARYRDAAATSSLVPLTRGVERRCVALKYKSVSRNAVRSRIQQLDPRTRHQHSAINP